MILLNGSFRSYNLLNDVQSLWIRFKKSAFISKGDGLYHFYRVFGKGEWPISQGKHI